VNGQSEERRLCVKLIKLHDKKMYDGVEAQFHAFLKHEQKQQNKNETGKNSQTTKKSWRAWRTKEDKQQQQ